MAELVMRGHWGRICDGLRGSDIDVIEDSSFIGRVDTYGCVIERVDEIVLRKLREGMVEQLRYEANRHRAKAMHVRYPLTAHEMPLGAYMIECRVTWEPFSKDFR